MRFLRKKRERDRRKKRPERREGKEMKEHNLKGNKKKARCWGPAGRRCRQKWESPKKVGVQGAVSAARWPPSTSGANPLLSCGYSLWVQPCSGSMRPS